MTLFRKMMEARLARNAKAVDELKAQERIIFQVQKVKAAWEALRGKVGNETGGINLMGNAADEASGVTLRDAKIIVDEYIYSDPRFDVYTHQGSGWIFNKITDKVTGGAFSIDF